MTIRTWFSCRKAPRSVRPVSQRSQLILEGLEDRALLSISSPSLSSMTNPVTSLISNPLSSIVNPLLGSVVNPLLGTVVNPLLSPIVSLISPVTNLLPAPVSTLATTVTPILSSLPAILVNSLFHPASSLSNNLPPAGASGLGSPNVRSSSGSSYYSSGTSAQSFYSGGPQENFGERPFDLEMNSSLAAGMAGIETVGLDNDDISSVEFSDVIVTVDDGLTIESFAETLLTGAKPQANLLPQRGAQVAPLATLLNTDSNESTSDLTNTNDENLN